MGACWRLLWVDAGLQQMRKRQRKEERRRAAAAAAAAAVDTSSPSSTSISPPPLPPPPLQPVDQDGGRPDDDLTMFTPPPPPAPPRGREERPRVRDGAFLAAAHAALMTAVCDGAASSFTGWADIAARPPHVLAGRTQAQVKDHFKAAQDKAKRHGAPLPVFHARCRRHRHRRHHSRRR